MGFNLHNDLTSISQDYTLNFVEGNFEFYFQFMSLHYDKLKFEEIFKDKYKIKYPNISDYELSIKISNSMSRKFNKKNDKMLKLAIKNYK